MSKIHKYRIVEFEDGYGKKWFRPQRKGWFRWHYARKYFGPYDLTGEVIEFETIEEAQHSIGASVNQEKMAMRDHIMTHTMIPQLAEVIALKIMQDARDKEK